MRILALFCFLLNSKAIWCQIHYKVVSPSKVKFEAQITFSSFEGTSENIVGEIVLDPKGNRIVSALLEVPIESIDTGLQKRNHHMIHKYLKNPLCKKVVWTISKPQVFDYLSSVNNVEGIWKICGIEKTSKVLVTTSDLITNNLNSMKDQIQAKIKFSLNILDFNIKQPRYLVVEMEPLLELEADLFFSKKSDVVIEEKTRR